MSVADDITNWMSFLKDDQGVTQLTFPGTHNSHATWDNYGEPSNFVPTVWAFLIADKVHAATTCQYSSIWTQLHEGIRYIDLRVGYDNYQLRHGKCRLKNNLFEATDWVKDFLNKHPTETILVNVQWDHDGRGAPEDMWSTVRALWDKHSWYRGNDWPTLKEARGKAILLRRFEGSDGIDFKDFYGKWQKEKPGAWSQQNDGMGVNMELNDLWERCWKQISRVSDCKIDDNWLYFTNLAMTGIPLSLWVPSDYAENMNPRLMRYLNGGINPDPSNHRYGCMIMDYYRRPYGLEIISKNWESKFFKPNQHVAYASDDPFFDMKTPRGQRVAFYFKRDAELRVEVDGQRKWSNEKKTGELSNNHRLFFESDGNLVIWKNDPNDREHGGRSYLWSTESRLGWDTRLRFVAGPPYIVVDFETGSGQVLWSTTNWG